MRARQRGHKIAPHSSDISAHVEVMQVCDSTDDPCTLALQAADTNAHFVRLE